MSSSDSLGCDGATSLVSIVFVFRSPRTRHPPIFLVTAVTAASHLRLLSAVFELGDHCHWSKFPPIGSTSVG
jgi:hypothetical protein